MRPRSLFAQFVFPVALGVLLAMACAFFAGAVQAAAAPDSIELLPLVAVLAGFAVPVGCAWMGVRNVRTALASLDDVGRALVAGIDVPASPAEPVSEIADVRARLAHAAGVARAREFGLRAADRAKDDFLAMLGHELRNPLSAQSAAAHVLRKSGRDNPTVAHVADVLTRQVQQMSRLIEDLLDVNRVIRGKVSLSKQRLSLAAAVEKAVAALRDSGRLQRHRLDLQLGEVWVNADEARVEQIVANMVGNAVKYTPSGGNVLVTLRRDGDHAVLRVKDDGVGMSPELAARVFDLFVQGQDGGHGGAGGLGIGLTLVKHLAELHGGRVFAASTGMGEGSVFTVTLPAIEPQDELAPPPTPAQDAQPRQRIVLMTEDRDARDMMFQALHLEGHRVFEAPDAPAALRAIEKLRPDATLVDLGNRGAAAYELASAVRGDPACEGMVLVAMTGHEQADTMQRTREAGFDECVTKPVAPDRLVRLIDAAQRRRAARAKLRLAHTGGRDG